MRELSLFTGCGGGVLGSHLLGWRPVGYVELDDYCQRVIAQRIRDGVLPDAQIFGDIRAFIAEGYAESFAGLVDVVTAGFPCQPFSLAGQRLGPDDSRNLWPETAECIRRVRPRHVLLENVPGITRYLPVVFADLRAAGYCVRPPARVAAASVGAGHLRRRIWIRADRVEQGARRVSDAVLLRDAEPGSQAEVCADGDGSRRQQPQGPNTDVWGWTCDGTPVSAHRYRRIVWEQPRRGKRSSGVLAAESGEDSQAELFANGDGLGQGCDAEALHARESESCGGHWWADEPGLARLVHGQSHRLERTRATGNQQIPAVVRAAWHALGGDR